jgi:hypothetical protein
MTQVGGPYLQAPQAHASGAGPHDAHQFRDRGRGPQVDAAVRDGDQRHRLAAGRPSR